MTQQFGEIEGVPVAFTDHALQRMVEMEITPNEIKKLLLEPEDVYTSRKYPGDVCHRRGPFALAIIPDESSGRYVIRTALYSTKAAWEQAKRDGKLGADRAEYSGECKLPIG